MLHQLGGYDFLPYSLLLTISIGLGDAVVFVRKIGAELMAPMRKIQRWLNSSKASPASRP